MFTHEAPSYFPINGIDSRHIFNWTISYSKASDFYSPFGEFNQLRDHPSGMELKTLIRQFGENNRHLAKNRTKLQAAWFASNCRSTSVREELVKELRHHMKVDVFGKCGSMKCAREGQDDTLDTKEDNECYKKVSKTYRFYLSFENSLCNDYVTEKFFYILHHNVIPITFGGADYDTLAPPHSYINVLDFASVKDLANYLKELQDDDAKYAAYFWWKEYYQVRSMRFELPLCSLCKRLHMAEEPPSSYEDLTSWWWSNGQCKKLNSLLGKEGRFDIATLKSPPNRFTIPQHHF